MSTVTAAIIFLGFVIYIGFQIFKNFQLSSINKALAHKDYETVLKIAGMPFTRKLIGAYTSDLYQLKALYLAKDPEPFEKQLHLMIAATYKNPDNKKSFLEQYFHTFLLKNNQKYAEWLLEGIRASGDEVFIRYNEQSYEVMINKRTDLIEEMNAEIDGKKYYGFALGVILFMIALQYEYLDNIGQAELYFENAKTCFHPQAIYVPAVQKHLEALHQKRIDMIAP